MYSILKNQKIEDLSARDLQEEIALARLLLEQKINAIQKHRKRYKNDDQLQFDFEFGTVEKTIKSSMEGDKFNNDTNATERTVDYSYGERTVQSWLRTIGALVKLNNEIGGHSEDKEDQRLFELIESDRLSESGADSVSDSGAE